MSLATVQYGVQHAGGRRLDRVDWASAPRGGRRDANATALEIENRVLRLRKPLQQKATSVRFFAELKRRNKESLDPA